jgi:hypothetical protein
MVLEESSIYDSYLYKQIPFISILVGILSNYFRYRIYRAYIPYR